MSEFSMKKGVIYRDDNPIFLVAPPNGERFTPEQIDGIAELVTRANYYSRFKKNIEPLLKDLGAR